MINIYLRLHRQCSLVYRTFPRWCASFLLLCVPVLSLILQRLFYAGVTIETLWQYKMILILFHKLHKSVLILTLSFFFLSGVMKPFFAFLALEASSMRLRTSARLRSISACLAFFAWRYCDNNEIGCRALLSFCELKKKYEVLMRFVF